MADVQLCKVSKHFDGAEVVRGIDLHIDDGEFVVFVGPSGCGKSTLLRLIAGLEEISSGDLFIGGQRVNNLPPSKRAVGMVFQSYALYPHMSVAQNMSFGLRLAKVCKRETLARVNQVARTLQLEDLLDRKPRDLSGGQRQRVAIGRALLREPRVFLFDEPLSNLDAALRMHMRIEIAWLHQRLGATMVYVTHDQVEAMTLADKIVVLNAGQVVQTGTPLELYHYPCNQFVAGFIGSPQMNFLAVEVLAASKHGLDVRVPGAGVLQLAVDVDRVNVGQTVILGVRPEHIVEPSAADCVIHGTVSVAECLGDHTLVYLRAPHIEGWVLLRANGDRPVSVGEAYHAGLPADRCHVFREDGSACQRRHREPAVQHADTIHHVSNHATGRPPVPQTDYFTKSARAMP